MEFNEKLQELRKSRGLTQEELAEALYVSRTAISKWESGRGYPSIDSLKEISSYFSVSIDDLLSGEKLISIAEKENKSSIKNICEMIFGVADLMAIMLIILPFYPKTIDNYVYSVNLWMYTATSQYNIMVYWVLFIALILSGALKIAATYLKIEKGQKILTAVSFFISIVMILFLALAREAYAAVVAFLLLIVKSIVVYRCVKSGF